MPRAKKTTTNLDTLAQMMAKGFEWVATRFDAIDQGFESLAHRVEKIETRLERSEKDDKTFRAEMRAAFDRLEARTFPAPLDREDLEARVAYLEKKLHIHSGK
jgi:hypothetical protein